MAKLIDIEQRRWWTCLVDEECPITLEPLSALPYPPFILFDRGGGGKHCAASDAKNCKYYFDGFALATYVVSQGTFANPLTRQPLDYDCCVRLDHYLDEHIYGKQNRGHDFSPSIAGSRERLSVKEAWLLRDSIKVKVGSGRNVNESDRRRSEELRNEASAALRGLFVFGHRSEIRRDNGISWESGGQTSSSETISRAPGGFDLHYTPDSNLGHSGGMNSSRRQEGLHIIDDDEAAYDAADAAAWRGVQAEFPYLGDGSIPQQPPLRNSNESDNVPSQILETVRLTADLAIREEKEKVERLQWQRQRYFMQALERKRDRIDARRKLKEDAVEKLQLEKEAQGELESARGEIVRWQAKQWEQWEQATVIQKSKEDVKDSGFGMKTPPETDEPEREKQQSSPSNQGLGAAEKAAKAAAKKKAKRQKAKERAKEKKRLESLEREEKERVLALQKQKESSAVKCGACDDGVLGCGFEKFGVTFCSPKCARNGPSSKD